MNKAAVFFVLCQLSFVLPAWALDSSVTITELNTPQDVTPAQDVSGSTHTKWQVDSNAADTSIATVTMATLPSTSTKRPTVTVTGLRNGTTTFTIKYGSSGSTWKLTVEVSSGDAPSSALTRTVSADGGWTDSVWSDGKTGGQAWTSGAAAEITVGGTVTLDVGTGAVTAGAVTLKGTGDLTLRNCQNLTASAINCSGLNGTVTFEYVSSQANRTVESTLISAIKAQTDQKVKYAFGGTTAANGWDLGSWSASTPMLRTHLVFGMGTHTWDVDNTGTGQKFGENGTDENPTVLVKKGATLTMKVHDLSGYQGAYAGGGVIRVNDGGVLDFAQRTSGNYFDFNYRQRLYLEPGSLVTFSYPSASSRKFTLHGGAGADPSQMQICVPASETDRTTKPATIRQLDGSCALMTHGNSSNRYPGFAAFVGANSKLKIEADLTVGEGTATDASKLAKYGDGELEITGTVTSIGVDAVRGVITLPAAGGKFNGNLFKATADVTYRFPAGWAPESAYTLGSAKTVTGTAPAADTATVYVGDETLTGATLVYSGATVKYALPAKPRTPIAVPTAAQGLVWGMTNQVGVAAGEGYKRGGTCSESAVGEYAATVTPDDDHCWPDLTRDTKTIRWSIARRPATVTVRPAAKAPNDPEPVFHTENEGFLAEDPMELAWTAWRTNTSEEVGTYDVVILGEKKQSGYDISYVGNTLTIENAPVGPTIPEEEGEIEYDPATKEVVVTPKDESVTEVEIVNMPADGTVKVPVSVGTIKGVEPGQVVEVFYTAPAEAGGRTYDITPAFTISGGKENGVTIGLNETASVTFDLGDGKTETITVTPTLTEVGDGTVEPLEVLTDEVDVGVKTIPGLTYALRRASCLAPRAEWDDKNSGVVDEKQAESLRTKLSDPMDGGKPQKAFYIIEVKK